MKRGIWILAGLVILAVGICVWGLVFKARLPFGLTPLLLGVPPEDVAFFECWMDYVDGPLVETANDLGLLSQLWREGEYISVEVGLSFLEDDIHVSKVGLLGCPTAKHPLLVSSREQSLRGLDLLALACQYLKEGLSTLDDDLIAKAADPWREGIDLITRGTSDLDRWHVEVLGK